MREVELLPHNQEGYEKLVESLEIDNFSAINHATGTGKSFILLKYLYKNKNKNILYLAPSYPILEQLKQEHMEELGINENEFVCFDTEIYSNLLKKNMKDIFNKYDIIILDEYHRCGARLWGKKVTELLHLIKNSNKEIKVIGTTATEIRYLDYERNMNYALFDGKVASTLTLSDAILKGILPIFEYHTSSRFLLDELDKIEDTVNNFRFDNEIKKQIYEEIIDLKNRVELKIKNEDFNMDPVNKKILVFSSNNEKIVSDSKLVSNILGDNPYKEYIVTYKNSKDRNNKLLKEFRNNSKDFASVLYSINILNEGVHVKDVDMIFMLRETKSPIVFFQQLGRLLSYGKRKDKVWVYDFSNNVKNHKVMYSLFQEVYTRACELVKNDSANRDRYINIINNFKFINESSELYDRVYDLKKRVSLDSLIKLKLDNSIDILLRNNSEDRFSYLQAYIDIFKYQRYINFEQFKTISSIDIIKPDIFSFSPEEFKKYLGDAINLKGKYNKNIFSYVMNFYKLNNHLPSINSGDEKEKKLANELMFHFDFFPESQQKKINSLVDYDLSLVEMINYGDDVDSYNYNDLFIEIDKCLKNKIYISDKIITELEKCDNEIAKNYINKIVSNNRYYLDYKISMFDDEKINIKKDNNKLKEHYSVGMDILFREEFNQYLKKYSDEFKMVNDKKEYLTILYNQIIAFVKNNYRFPEYSDEEKELFYKTIIFSDYLKQYGFDEKLKQTYLSVKDDMIQKEKDKILSKIIKFMNDNHGQLPSINSNNCDETLLAQNYKKYVNSLTDDDMNKILEVQNKYDNYRVLLIKKYINFIRKRKRVPIMTMDNDYEKKLALEFYRIQFTLSDDEKMIIDSELNKINNYDQTRQLYRDMLKLKSRR